jgi:hypothetical protein
LVSPNRSSSSPAELPKPSRYVCSCTIPRGQGHRRRANPGYSVAGFNFSSNRAKHFAPPCAAANDARERQKALIVALVVIVAALAFIILLIASGHSYPVDRGKPAQGGGATLNQWDIGAGGSRSPVPRLLTGFRVGPRGTPLGSTFKPSSRLGALGASARHCSDCVASRPSPRRRGQPRRVANSKRRRLCNRPLR